MEIFFFLKRKSGWWRWQDTAIENIMEHFPKGILPENVDGDQDWRLRRFVDLMWWREREKERKCWRRFLRLRTATSNCLFCKWYEFESRPAATLTSSLGNVNRWCNWIAYYNFVVWMESFLMVSSFFWTWWPMMALMLGQDTATIQQQANYHLLIKFPQGSLFESIRQILEIEDCEMLGFGWGGGSEWWREKTLKAMHSNLLFCHLSKWNEFDSRTAATLTSSLGNVSRWCNGSIL